MKIGFVLDDGLNKPDGVQQAILTLGKYLSDNGHEVRYLVGETDRSDISGVYSMSKNIKVSFNGNTLSVPMFASIKNIKKILKKEQFDVLHLQMPYSPFMGARVIKRANKYTAIVGTFHILPYGILSRYGTRALGLFFKRNLKHIDVIASVSKPAAQFALETFNVKSQVIPNPVNLDFYKPKTLSKKRLLEGINLLFVGRLVPRKGCRKLLEALVILKSNNQLHPKIILHIVGDGVMRDELKNYVTEYGIADQVVFHGFVTEEKKAELMQTADISVFPSISGESFGIVLVEAMAAAGGVVLGGDNPGYKSVLEDLPGSLISPESPELMAEQLYEMISSPTKRAVLYKQQQHHVQQYDVSVVAEKYMTIYQTCKKQRINR